MSSIWDRDFTSWEKYVTRYQPRIPVPFPEFLHIEVATSPGNKDRITVEVAYTHSIEAGWDAIQEEGLYFYSYNTPQSVAKMGRFTGQSRDTLMIELIDPKRGKYAFHYTDNKEGTAKSALAYLCAGFSPKLYRAWCARYDQATVKLTTTPEQLEYWKREANLE